MGPDPLLGKQCPTMKRRVAGGGGHSYNSMVGVGSSGCIEYKNKSVLVEQWGEIGKKSVLSPA